MRRLKSDEHKVHKMTAEGGGGLTLLKAEELDTAFLALSDALL